MFWYLLSDAGYLEESREILRNDISLAHMYKKKFNAVYKLGFINLITRATHTITDIIKGEAIPGQKKVTRIIKNQAPKIICFVGKISFQQYTGRKTVSFGWQEDIAHSKVFVMHAPLRGKASIRIDELHEIENLQKKLRGL